MMSPALDHQDSGAGPSSRIDTFATTRWTVVLAAGRPGSPQAAVALEELCRTYWFPLYAYVRRRGQTREDAEDLTQAFFARLLEKGFLESADEERGRFRAFLLMALKRFMANEWDRSRTLKRGGGATPLPLDPQQADTQFLAASNDLPPDRAFDREWAVALLERVVIRLRDECIAEGRAGQFAHLKIFLTSGKGTSSHAEAAALLGMEEGAVRVAVHRLRKRYRQLLRNEVSQTLTKGADVDAEMAALFGAFSR